MIDQSPRLKPYEIVLGLLVIAAAATAVFLWGPNAKAPVTEKAAESAPATATASQEEADPAPAPAPIELPKPPSPEGDGQLQPGQTFSSALEACGLSGLQIHGVVSSISKLYDFRLARPGAKFSYQLNPNTGALIHLRFEPGPLEIFEVTRDAAGGYIAKAIAVETTQTKAEIAAEIQSSLWAAIQSTGESPGLYAKLADVFAWDIDFSQNSYSGDHFKLIIEKTLKEGQFVKYGRVLAAEYVGKAGEFRSFWYTPPGGEGGYYLEDGQSAKKNFLATPLKYTRISSAFGKRKHPILGFNKQHNGVDFAAPTGTPVWAMGAGVVQFAGKKGANGNLVVIAHENGYVSYYAHLHRIQKGIQAGVKVEQKQLIGQVGSTGRSTGPHLHLGLKHNGAYVDPLQIKVIRSHSLSKAHLPAFKTYVAEMRKRLDSIPENTHLQAPPSKGDPEESGFEKESDEEASFPPLEEHNNSENEAEAM